MKVSITGVILISLISIFANFLKEFHGSAIKRHEFKDTKMSIVTPSHYFLFLPLNFYSKTFDNIQIWYTIRFCLQRLHIRYTTCNYHLFCNIWSLENNPSPHVVITQGAIFSLTYKQMNKNSNAYEITMVVEAFF